MPDIKQQDLQSYIVSGSPGWIVLGQPLKISLQAFSPIAFGSNAIEGDKLMLGFTSSINKQALWNQLFWYIKYGGTKK